MQILDVPWVILEKPCNHTKAALFGNKLTLKRPLMILTDPSYTGISVRDARQPQNCYNAGVGIKFPTKKLFDNVNRPTNPIKQKGFAGLHRAGNLNGTAYNCDLPLALST